MERRPAETTRDRALWYVRLATLGGAAGALGLSWLFANLAESYFSGRMPVVAPPQVPVAAMPVQQPPTVVQSVVHHPYKAGTPSKAAGTAPRPPSRAPAAAPHPPPAPVCHSTPSKPC